MAQGITSIQRSGWRFFPVWVIGALAVVIAVNVVFITIAEKTFPGETGGDPYDTGIKYNYVLNDAAREARMGWKITAATTGGNVVIKAQDRDGSVLSGQITAVALRPLGDPSRTPLHFWRGVDGAYHARESLAPGQWDVMTNIAARGQTYRITERLVVK